MNNEYRMCHKKSDRTWPLCDPVGKGGTRAASQYPHRDDQSNALKGHKSPSGHLGEGKSARSVCKSTRSICKWLQHSIAIAIEIC